MAAPASSALSGSVGPAFRHPPSMAVCFSSLHDWRARAHAATGDLVVCRGIEHFHDHRRLLFLYCHPLQACRLRFVFHVLRDFPAVMDALE
jgi:hypothetical protein